LALLYIDKHTVAPIRQPFFHDIIIFSTGYMQGIMVFSEKWAMCYKQCPGGRRNELYV